MKKITKFLAGALACAAVAGAAVGGTVAWLTDKTPAVVNTFSYGNIDVDLTETTLPESYVIIPGTTIKKDPKVTVSTPEGAEAIDSYVFVKMTENNWPAVQDPAGEGQYVDKVRYEIAEGWTKLEGEKDVYWREVAKDADVKIFSVLKDDALTVSETLTKEEIDGLSANKPTLTFKAYAVQKSGINSAADAWAKIPASEK